MSKNTERGIGQHVGPAADGRPDDVRPRLASETSVVGPAPQNLDRDGKPPAAKVEVAQITLLGVSPPELDREKVTTPGRDVHLPKESRRAPAPRAVALDSAASPPSGDHRKTPDAPRPRATAASAPPTSMNGEDLISTVNARLAETGEVGRTSFRSAGRNDFGETMLMDAVPEPGRGASIALGIAISLVAAAVVVWTVRFGPHLRGFEAAVAERPTPPSEPAPLPLRGPRPTGEVRLPPARGATPLPAEGEPSGTSAGAVPAARGWPSPEEAAGARGTPSADAPPAQRENSESAAREPRTGSPAATGAPEEDGRRKNQRLRTPPSSSSERTGSSFAVPKRSPAPPIYRGGEAPGPFPTSPPPVGSGRLASPEPPRFEPPPPATTAPAPASEKPQYDPDSPLPPAPGE